MLKINIKIKQSLYFKGNYLTLLGFDAKNIKKTKNVYI